MERSGLVGHGLTDRGADVQIQRFANGARLFRAIQYGDLFNALGHGADKVLNAERTEQANLDQADLFALAAQMVHGFVGGLCTGAHHHDDLFSIRIAHIIKQMILTADNLGKLIHGLLDDIRCLHIKFVNRLATLEIDIRVLSGTADRRMVRAQRTGLMCGDERIVDNRTHIVIGNLFDLLNFVTGTEAIEEVQERNAGRQRGLLRDQRQVHDFLNIVRGQHSVAGLATGHHIGMVAEDAQCLAGQRAGGHVKDCRGQFAGDLVHIRDHQQQAL